MTGVGAGGEFERRSTVACDLAAVTLGVGFVRHDVVIVALTFAIALLSTSHHRPRAAASEILLVVQRMALAVVVLGLVHRPLATAATAAAAVSVSALVLRRLGDRARRRRAYEGHGGQRAVLAGESDDVAWAAQLFVRHPEYGVRPVATATPDGYLPTVLPGGSYDDLPRIVEGDAVEHLVVLSHSAGDHVAGHYGLERPLGVRFSVLPPLADLLTAGVEVVDVRGVPFLSLRARRSADGAGWAIKRALDFVIAGAALCAAAPFLALIGLVVLVDSGRPVFYRQKRVGRDGKLFDLWKFRSMVRDADDRLADLWDRNEAEGPYFKLTDDPRETRVGRWLRRTSLDELPQLYNVLRGDMSLVGPRPFLPRELDSDRSMFAWRLSFLPGITGLWQIAGRSWLPVEEGLRADLAYVEHWSVWLDLRILARTLAVVVRGQRRPCVVAPETMPLQRLRYLGMVVDDDLHPRSARPDVSVVVVTHESEADIERCLESLRHLPDTVSREVIVVDNASRDRTTTIVAERFPDVRLIRKRRRSGFATNCNIGAVASAGRHVMLLNPDTRVFPAALDQLVAYLDTHPAAAAVGPQLVYPDGSRQASVRRFPTALNTIVRRTPLRLVLGSTAGTRRHLCDDLDGAGAAGVDWVLGAALAVRADALREVGGLDEGYRLYCEDIDLCWRLQERGWAVAYLPSATIEHDLGELTARRFLTVRTVWHFRSMVRFVRHHGLGRPATPARVPQRVIDLRPVALSPDALDLSSAS